MMTIANFDDSSHHEIQSSQQHQDFLELHFESKIYQDLRKFELDRNSEVSRFDFDFFVPLCFDELFSFSVPLCFDELSTTIQRGRPELEIAIAERKLREIVKKENKIVFQWAGQFKG